MLSTWWAHLLFLATWWAHEDIVNHIKNISNKIVNFFRRLLNQNKDKKRIFLIFFFTQSRFNYIEQIKRVINLYEIRGLK